MHAALGGGDVSADQIKDYLWKTLKSGQVVPGYGHGVLRAPDPRFAALLQFCESRPALLADPSVRLVKQTFEVAPDVLKEHGKVGAR
jgi:citrate synthase